MNTAAGVYGPTDPSERQLLVQLRQVGLQYRVKTASGQVGKHWVLENVDLDLYRGQTIGLIGRNGAGKSSLLRVMAGLIDCDRGSVVNRAGRTVLLSFRLGFNNLLSGRENAIYMGLLLGMTRREIESRLDHIADFSELGEALEMPLGQYSSGMRARLGFSIAIQVDADIILIDEALGVGDHAFRQKSVALMKSWIQTDKTVVFVSHDQQHVKDLCDQVLWLENGRIVDAGQPDAVFDHYNEFDHIVACLAADLGVSEVAVRTHPHTAEPLAWMRRFRGKVKSEWNEEDYVDPRQKSSGLRIYRPGRSSPHSQVVEEECGSSAWIENARQIARGSVTTSLLATAVISRSASRCCLSESLLAGLNLTAEQYRDSQLSRRILDSLVRVGESNAVAAPDRR